MNSQVAFVVLFLLSAAYAAAQPAVLVVGEVRDQRGVPVEDARIVAYRADGGVAATSLTAGDGTFAVHAGGVVRLVITCRYCESLALRVRSSEPVVAIARRYDELLSETPSAEDAKNLPYAHAESILSLRPFTVLEDSSEILPGPLLSDRGLSSQGGAVVDAGVPNYDPVANISPFFAIPSFYASSVSAIEPSQAFIYGDRAGSGTFLVGPRSESGTSGLAFAGGQSALLAADATNDVFAAFGDSSSPGDWRERADADATLSLAGGSIDVGGFDTQSRATRGSQSLAASFAAFDVAFTSDRSPLETSVDADRGTYTIGFYGHSIAAGWSDVAADVALPPPDGSGAFGGVGFHHSSGFYSAPSGGLGDIAASMDEIQADVGFIARSPVADIRGGIGAFAAAYTGGANEASGHLDATMLVPSIDVAFSPGSRWSAEIEGSESFRLPTLLETYATAPDQSALAIDRDALLSATIAYSDMKRLRIEATAAREHVAGLDNGEVSAVGLSVAWQATPLVTLRTWALHTGDATVPYEPVVRFGAKPQPGTVGSAWLTYESRAVRIDVIWRRDLLDYSPNEHLDGSISAPLARHIRWYIASEERRRYRSLTAGVRFSRMR